MQDNKRNTRFTRNKTEDINKVLCISIILINFVLLFNSSYGFTFQTNNKLYFGQSRLRLELNSTGVEPFFIMENQEEIWKDIVGYNGRYRISNNGRVMSLARPNVKTKYGKINSDGYNCTSLMIYGVRKFYTVHRLVAMHFIENTNNYEIVNHLNGIKTDNRVENLEWCTTQQNTEHAVKNNLLPFGEDNHRSKLTKQIVLEIRRKYTPKVYSQNMLAKEFNVSKSAINHVIYNRVWKRVL